MFPTECRLHKAPSVRELSPQATEGECVYIKIQQNSRSADSFHHFVVSLPEGGFGEMKITAGTQ